jgi:hypothetical protein
MPRIPAATQRKDTLHTATPSTKQAASFANSHQDAVAQPLFNLIQQSPRIVAQRELADVIAQSPRVALQREQMAMFRGKSVHGMQSEDRVALPGNREESASDAPVQAKAEPAANRTGTPDPLLAGIENLSGFAMGHVRVHFNSDKPAQLNAHAFAQGRDIHLAPGREKHLPHEAWHVVQQMQGRVRLTMQMKGGVQVNDDESLEKEADIMGARAMQLHALGGPSADDAAHHTQDARRAAPQYGYTGAQVPVQLARLTGQQAADQAAAARAATPNNRAAFTNDWISTADNVATSAAWAHAAPAGYTYNTSVSHTNGGPGRPTSVDLKAKPTGNLEAQFIFHLPEFNGIPDMINYLIDTSGIRAKINEIAQVSAYNKNTTTDFELGKIRDAQTVNIAPLRDHPIYTSNSADILAVQPNFLTDLQQNQIGVANTTLENIRADGTYRLRLANMEARAARIKYLNRFRVVLPYLPDDRSKSNVSAFNGIVRNIEDLKVEYAAALPVLDKTQKDQHTQLMEIFNRYREILTNASALKGGLEDVLRGALTTSFIQESWQNTVNSYGKFGQRFEDLRPNLTVDERKSIADLLRHLKEALRSRKPAAEEASSSREEARKRPPDRDDKDGSGGEKQSRVERQAAAVVPPATIDT